MYRLSRTGVRGFSLIELMVAIAIVAILASVALTSYRDSVAKARRADAVTSLIAGAQLLERHYSINGKYLDVGGNLASGFDTQSPKDGAAAYTIAVQGTATNNSYKLRATRAGSMASDPCGNYEINETGAITLVGNASNKTTADCVKR